MSDDVDAQPSITSEEFLRLGRDVRIANQIGFLCKVRMKALIDIPPEELFVLLTSENNSSVFSSIDRTIRRDVISEDSNERVVYLEQAARVGALMFKKQFTTACYVTEYKKKLSADFSLAKPGVMASFQGHWSLTPVSLEAFDRMSAERRPQEAWEKDLISTSRSNSEPLTPTATSAASMKTLMYLDQDVGPAAARKVPAVFHGVLRRMCSSAAIDVFKDLTVVAALRQKGVPLETLLESRVHGSGGLKRGMLHRGRRNSEASGVAPQSKVQDHEGVGKPGGLHIGDASSSCQSSAIRSFAFDVAGVDLEDDTEAQGGSVCGTSRTCSALPSPRVVLRTSPARATLKSFRLLDVDAVS